MGCDVFFACRRDILEDMRTIILHLQEPSYGSSSRARSMLSKTGAVLLRSIISKPTSQPVLHKTPDKRKFLVEARNNILKWKKRITSSDDTTNVENPDDVEFEYVTLPVNNDDKVVFLTDNDEKNAHFELVRDNQLYESNDFVIREFDEADRKSITNRINLSKDRITHLVTPNTAIQEIFNSKLPFVVYFGDQGSQLSRLATDVASQQRNRPEITPFSHRS